ncbi:SMI1/KNR4 family protein [Streptomyces sp. NPDC021093]|uniref:SMI1/KNR4 family protein n=1 Tax=Streptomyces sp. NPDC021093 TaxID=3365112 RepID=UPI00378C2CD5
MNVDILPHIRATANELGIGVPYALKVLAGQLADNPDLGQPSPAGVCTVTIDGELFEDCPPLVLGYLRESSRIEVQYLTALPSGEPLVAPEQEPAVDFATMAVAQRQTNEAWSRIANWLGRHAPLSHAALRAGLSTEAIAALEDDLHMQVPAELRALWMLTGGDDGVDGAGCLPGNQALMAPDAVVDWYRQQMDSQARQDALNARCPDDDRITVWNASWIPIAAYGPTDHTSGLYLDTATGHLGRWSRYNEGPGDSVETLTSYLEDIADTLEAPALAVRDKPGLLDGVLVWGSRLDPSQEERWSPLAP